MARADLLVDLVKYSCAGNNYQYKKTIEALIADERKNSHTILADKLQRELDLLVDRISQCPKQSPGCTNVASGSEVSNYLYEVKGEVSFDQMVLHPYILKQTDEIVEEHMRADLLRSYSIEPRNKLLLVGPPGTGKTTYAMALAERLMLPLYVVRYDALVGSYLGETAARLSKMMDYAKTHPCVLFFDEFDTIGKERGDSQEVGEIKRVVSSLLMQIDTLPSYSMAIGATNHPELLDRAVWRRFQVKIDFPNPSKEDLERWIKMFFSRYAISVEGHEPMILQYLMGHSYADAEIWGMAYVRRYILKAPINNIKPLLKETLVDVLGEKKQKSRKYGTL